jgi:uncharacterized protein with ATP-grasp and redox domains
MSIGLFRTLPANVTRSKISNKGMGNFKTLAAVQQPIFFLLKAKCDIVATHIGVEVGDSVLFASNVP